MRASWLSIHLTMFIQVARDFSGIGDVRELPASDIRWFYGTLVPELIRATKREA